MEPETRLRVGFIGIGLMGEAMVLRLLERGWPVAAWNLTADRYARIVPAGATVMPNPAALVEQADLVMMCVLDAPAVENCVFGENGIAAARSGASLVVDHSTINPDATRDIAARLAAARPIRWLDAPVSGGPEAARAGTLTIMAGGEEADFAAARPALADLGANVTHLGPLGAGQTAKILNQAIVGVGHVLMAETLALARAAGLAPEKLPASLAGGYADSVMLQRLFPRMCAGAFEPPSGYARQLLKDLKNVVGFAHDLDLVLPVLEEAFAQYKAHVDAGNALRDSASIAELYAKQGTKAGHG